MVYLIYSFVFIATFSLTFLLFPKASDKVIRERLVIGEKIAKRKPFAFGRELLRAFAPLNKPLKLKSLRQKTKKALASAGSSFSVDEFFVIKELGIIFLPLLYVMVVDLANAQPVWIVALAGIGFILPDFWLKQKAKARNNAIIKALPNTIDLLNLAVGAGLDFMVAVKKMVEWSKPNPLVEELHQVWQETNMGTTRRNALRNMGRRLNIPEISSFVRTLVQADRMGTSIGEALQMQAEEALFLRFQRGEREALKAPIKMLFPLMVFILPVVLIIVAGPIALQFLQGGYGLR